MASPQQLDIYESTDIVPLKSRAPGTYKELLEIRGNSLLSTVFIKSIDAGATLKVNYYYFTTGKDDGERKDLNGHALLNSASTTPNQIVVTRIHNRVFVECVVTGGNAEFSVYTTVVQDFPMEGEVSIEEGSGINSFQGIPDQVSGSAETDGTTQELISVVVPVGKKWSLFQATVACRSYGIFEIKVNGTVVGSGRTGPASENVKFTWPPLYPIAAASTLKLEFTKNFGPNVPVEAYITRTEQDA